MSRHFKRNKIGKRGYFLIALVVIGMVACFVFDFNLSEVAVYKNSNQYTASVSKTLPKKQKKEDVEKIKIFAVGDIMLDRGVELKTNLKNNGDYRWPFLKIKEYLDQADILVGNLEGPISNRGNRIGSVYSFRFSPSSVEGLLYAGFDVLSLANNHLLDYGRIALKDTMKILKDNGIKYVGAGFDEKEAFSLKTKEVKGTKIGFLAFTGLGPHNWRAQGDKAGMAWINKTDMEILSSKIRKYKEKVSVLIVSLHAGKEYKTEPTPFQKKFAKKMLGSGADLIIGHHSHVIGEVKKIKGGWTAYSLGNFVFDQTFSKRTMTGLVLEIIIKGENIEKVDTQRVNLSENLQLSIE